MCKAVKSFLSSLIFSLFRNLETMWGGAFLLTFFRGVQSEVRKMRNTKRLKTCTPISYFSFWMLSNVTILYIVYQFCIKLKFINPVRGLFMIHEKPCRKPVQPSSWTYIPSWLQLGSQMLWWCSQIWIFLFEIQGETGKVAKFIERSRCAKHCVLSCRDQEGWDLCGEGTGSCPRHDITPPLCLLRITDSGGQKRLHDSMAKVTDSHGRKDSRKAACTNPKRTAGSLWIVFLDSRVI